MRVETKKSDGLGFISELGLSVRATNVLIQMGLNAASQLAELDQQTLMRKRNCGKKTTAEILEAAARFKPSIESSANKMDATSLSAAIEHTPVTDLRLSVRAMGALERLRISTIGQLARLS